MARMKQRITGKQLNELGKKEAKALRKWWKPKIGDWFTSYKHPMDPQCLKGDYGDDIENEKMEEKLTPLLSIGQMVEFLKKSGLGIGFQITYRPVYQPRAMGLMCTAIDEKPWKVALGAHMSANRGMDVDQHKEAKELCDALWQAVKEVLEK